MTCLFIIYFLLFSFVSHTSKDQLFPSPSPSSSIHSYKIATALSHFIIGNTRSRITWLWIGSERFETISCNSILQSFTFCLYPYSVGFEVSSVEELKQGRLRKDYATILVPHRCPCLTSVHPKFALRNFKKEIVCFCI